MKLAKKERFDRRVKQKYDKAKTLYQRLLESGKVITIDQKNPETLYASLNSTELKRQIAKRPLTVNH